MLFIFDMGGVVTNTFKSDGIYKSLNLTKEEFWTLCKKNNLWDNYQKGLISSNEFWKNFNNESKNMNLPPVKNDLFRFYFHPVENPITVDLIKKLKLNNRVVCGTNTCQSHYENHMERGDYLYFHQTYASNKIGVVKPDLEFWKLIMMAEGYDPKDTFFVDDKIENCKAAEKLGINTVLFSSAEDLVSKWEKYI